LTHHCYKAVMSFARLSLALGALFVAACGSPAVTVEPPVVPTSTAPAPKPTATAAATASASAVAVAPVKSPVAAQIEIEATPAQSLVDENKSSDLMVRFRVRGLALVGEKRPPINLALVVDSSGSMDGAPITRAREACATLLDALKPDDAVSIVTFGSQPRVVVPAIRVSAESRAKAQEAVKSIKAEGTTDMAGGLQFGLAQARTFFAANGINRIVLLGDGVPNDPVATLSMADQAKNQQISVTALGLGIDFDETQMTAVAQRSGGTYHFIDDAARVATVFEQELSKMQRVVARRAHIDVTPGPSVTVHGAIGLPHQLIGRTMRVQLGDIGEGQSRDVVVRLNVTARKAGAPIELADALVRYEVTVPDAPPTVSKFVGMAASSDPAAVKSSHNAEVERQATRLRVADNIVRAIAMARGSDLAGARKLLDATSKFAAEGAKLFDDAELVAKVKEIQELKKSIASLVPPPVHQNFGGGMGIGPPKSVQKAPSPAAALGVRRAHGDAMKVIDGF
jgi:Ca-activated chloride channel family protein